jgi:hypothetical protein
MGVVNTTYTFTSTDTITSAKMNNIIDETTFTSDAIQGTTLQVVSPGKLAVNALGITSNELASGAVIQAKLGTNVASTGPAFFAKATANLSIPNNSNLVVTQLNSTEINLGSCFNTSTYRFTPNVAGYYQINASMQIDVNASGVILGTIAVSIRKNGNTYYDVSLQLEDGLTSFLGSGSALIEMNGSTDYIDLVGALTGGTATNAVIYAAGGSRRTFMSGFLARSA